MTRLLSQLLGAREPDFQLHLQHMERSAGHPNVDIYMSAEIERRVQGKVCELGLDPIDTTGPELYHALEQRLLADEHRLRESLGLQDTSPTDKVFSAVHQFVLKTDIPRSCFALKTSAAKRLLKSLPPKKTMKALGYRSLESMLKHEQAAPLFAAAQLYEARPWQRSVLERYRRLMPSDFEVRTITLQLPKAKRWEQVAKAFATQRHHTSVGLRELGAIVTFPVQSSVPALAVTSMLLLLDEINAIRCCSTFLKLQQVRPNFGEAVIQAAQGEPTVTTELTTLSGSSLPWHVMQYYYCTFREAYHPALFEPHVQPEDLKLAEAERALAQSVPALEFWQDTADLALLYNGQPVSLNMLDVALGTSNQLKFEDRIVHNLQRNIFTRLIVKYLQRNRSHQLMLNLDELMMSNELMTEDLAV